MFIRSTCLSLAILLSAAVHARDSDRALDYDLLVAVTPIGESAVELRPAKGEKLLLQFWASWCHSCGTIMWDMDEIVGDNPGVKYIAVSLDDDFSDAQDYIRGHSLYQKYSDRYFIDTNKRLSVSLGVASVPSILLVDDDGKILLRKFGHLNSADLQDFVAAVHTMP